MSKLVAIPNLLMKKFQPKVSNFLYYAKVELIPPTPGEFPEVVKGFGRVMLGWKNGAWKQLTVKEAFLNALVTTEVICWFYIGECIGKRSIVGYSFN